MNESSHTRPPHTPDPPLAADAPRQAFSYGGSMGKLAKIALVNVLLGVVTLGFYRFWGKTRLRRYLWGQIGFEGEPLEYTGSGKELFVGFLVVVAVLLPVGVVLGIVDYALTGLPEWRVVSSLVQLVLILFLVQYAIFRARRYRLTRTQWRGIRGGQSGSAVRYALIALGWLFVTMLTLGLAYPVMRTRLQRYRTENTWFGGQRFSFHGSARRLFAPWILAWLLMIPTLGLSYLWYLVREFGYFVETTRLGALSFASTLSTGRVVGVGVRFVLMILAVSLVAMAFVAVAAYLVASAIGPEAVDALVGPDFDLAESSGLISLVPLLMLLVIYVFLGVVRVVFLVHPLIRAVCASLSVAGREDYDAIRQSEQARPRRGEGLADAFDVGSI